MKGKGVSIILTVLFVVLASGQVAADEVWLKNGDRLTGNQTGLQKHTQDRRHPSGPVQVFQMVLAPWAQTANMGSFFADGVEQVQGQVKPGLMGHGRDVQDRVGGASQGHIHCHGVSKRRQSGDLTR